MTLTYKVWGKYQSLTVVQYCHSLIRGHLPLLYLGCQFHQVVTWPSTNYSSTALVSAQNGRTVGLPPCKPALQCWFHREITIFFTALSVNYSESLAEGYCVETFS